jgi:hypothetical protein
VNVAVPAGVFLDGPSCVALSRLLAPAVRMLGPAELDRLRPALAAIGKAAEDQRIADAGRLALPSTSVDGWLPTKEYARLTGVSEQAVRKRIKHGTLCAERRGRAWVVDPTCHS